MAGHRDDGTFAEDKAHHPNRGVSRKRVTNTQGILNVGPYDENDPINILRYNILNYKPEKD